MTKTLAQLIRDSTTAPFEADWKQVYNRVLTAYIHQPLVARKLIALGSGTLIPVEFDGRRMWESAQLNDVDAPDYNFTPGERDTNIDGNLINTPLPQIFETVTLGKDDLKMLFAGQSRLPIILNQITKKIAEKEDQIVFRGDTATGVTGLVGGAYSLSATGHWGIDAGSNGILHNVRLDFKQAIDYFTSNGLGDRRIDVVCTSYVYNLLRTTIKVYGDMFVMDWIKPMLNGGEIFQSNNIQSSVETTSNTVIWIVRDPEAWALLSSEMEQAQIPKGLWSYQYGIREKFSVKTLNNKYVCKMSSIDIAST